MISHKHKCIFIHIPKSAGSSVFRFFNPDLKVDWRTPNYDVLYGWCPKRKIHLQHATTDQLLDTELISEEIWDTYYKFTIVRNPWDRAYSDYLWIKSDRKVKGSFNDFIQKKGQFKDILTDNNNMFYRGDHLINQTDFFYINGKLKVDNILRFENFTDDINFLIKKLNIEEEFNIHEKKSKKRYKHYSFFYNNSKRKIIEEKYQKDIEILDYTFEDKKNRLLKLKNYI